MPKWMLKCPDCSSAFPYTTIESELVEQAHRDPFRILPKPELAPDGQRLACPECTSESVFHRHQLFYYQEPPDLSF
jgi:Txe/YoeB family toxin of Txe-Axe toxin-antitoxin module